MSWIELSLQTTHEAVDWICTLLATVEYPGELRIVDQEQPSEWAFRISLYLPNDRQVQRWTTTIANLLSPLQRTGLTTELEIAVLENLPSATLASTAHRVGNQFVILKPDSVYSPQAGDIPLRLETNLSFGSGLHPATRLSLELLERHVLPTMKVLDFGCGSGILSVAMAKMGAQVLALDNDSVAVKSAQATVQLNGLDAQISVREGSLGQGSDLGHWMGGSAIVPAALSPTASFDSSFDLIVANILARIHMTLAADFHRSLRRTDAHAGILITAGFTEDREADVNTALTEAGLIRIETVRSQEWVAFAHRLAV